MTVLTGAFSPGIGLESRVDGTPQPAVLRPPGELYLYRQLRFHPVHADGDVRRHGERRLLHLHHVQLFPDAPDFSVGEARYAARIPKLALLVEHPEQQRSEERTRATGLGP